MPSAVTILYQTLKHKAGKGPQCLLLLKGARSSASSQGVAGASWPECRAVKRLFLTTHGQLAGGVLFPRGTWVWTGLP